MSVSLAERELLFVEPFFGGSHARFARTVTEGIGARWELVTLPARHWKWRARGAALDLRERIESRRFDLVFATSMLPLAEIGGLCPQLASVPKVLFFHENQFAYPNRAEFTSDRDTHYAFTQVTSAAAADVCVFNSEFNLRTFLHGAHDFVKRMPDARPLRTVESLASRCRVLPLPLDFPASPHLDVTTDPERGPLLLWNHRWEHDKGPARFFSALAVLQREGVPFRVAVCGERYRECPPEFDAAERDLAPRVDHWGFCESRAEYAALLERADVVVSTADHEFFGVAVLEAVHAGARPLVPDRLAYPEHIPAEYRYLDDADFIAKLRALCVAYAEGKVSLRADRMALTSTFAADVVLPRYASLLTELLPA